MATEKRQRQDERREAKLAEQQTVEAQQERKRKNRKYYWIAGAAAVVVGVFVAANVFGGSGDEVEIAAVTTIADPTATSVVGSLVSTTSASSASSSPNSSPTSAVPVPTTTPAPTTKSAATTKPAPTTSTIPPTTRAPATTSVQQAVLPLFDLPLGDPPKALETKDLIVGTGRTVVLGDRVVVNYKGIAWTTRIQFDSSFQEGREPFEIQVLGAGTVIPGWEQGLLGMKVGGRRVLTIPPDLGYGASGQPPAIGANETLVFIVDLLDASASGTIPTTTVPAPDLPTPSVASATVPGTVAASVASATVPGTVAAPVVPSSAGSVTTITAPAATSTTVG